MTVDRYAFGSLIFTMTYHFARLAAADSDDSAGKRGCYTLRAVRSLQYRLAESFGDAEKSSEIRDGPERGVRKAPDFVFNRKGTRTRDGVPQGDRPVLFGVSVRAQAGSGSGILPLYRRI